MKLLKKSFISLVLLCAMLLTYLVEKPCARLIKRRLSPRKGS